MASLSVDPKNIAGAAPAAPAAPTGGQDNFLTRLVRDHLRFIIAIIVLLIAVVIIYALVKYFHQRGVAEGQANLHTIVTTRTGQDKAAALEQLLGKVSGDVRPAVAFELVRTGLELNDLKLVEKGWTAVGSASSGLDISKEVEAVAAMGQVSARLEENDIPGALAILNSLRKSAPASFKPMILSRLSMVYELAGDHKAAADVIEEMKMLDPAAADRYDQRIADLRSRAAANATR